MSGSTPPAARKRPRDNNNATQPAVAPKRSKRGKRRVQFAQPDPSEYVRVIPISKHVGDVPSLNTAVLLSLHEKASSIVLSDDRLSATSSKGYRTVKATHGVFEGTWYFEISVAHLGTTGHCRLGWATHKAELQAPIGYDKHGFSYRDVEGSKVHQGLREDYGDGYAEGDVIGCLIHLPQGGRPIEKAHKDVVKWKGGLYFVNPDEVVPNVLQGSFVGFSKNGQWQGVAYRDVLEGTYYPAASLYTMPEQTEGATVTFNFGPEFKHAPPDLPECDNVAPMSRATEIANNSEATSTDTASQPESTPNGSLQHIAVTEGAADNAVVMENGIAPLSSMQNSNMEAARAQPTNAADGMQTHLSFANYNMQ